MLLTETWWCDFSGLQWRPISAGYANFVVNCTYFRFNRSLVDPHKSSGQNLYRQYAGKKQKIVLDSRWVHECIKANQLQTFHNNWAECKVTGTERY